ncbi:hypothetical protein B9057_07745 [Aestuarium zhoushanense]|nr:hypothetical protein B9057_07745 [Aestuarium zhoushanense]
MAKTTQETNDETEVLGADAAETAAPEATEKTEDQLRPTVGATVRRLLTETDLGYPEIVDKVLEEHPDARTTARSVASVASTLRKKGVDVPMRRRTKN